MVVVKISYLIIAISQKSNNQNQYAISIKSMNSKGTCHLSDFRSSTSSLSPKNSRSAPVYSTKIVFHILKYARVDLRLLFIWARLY
jgi:hypothetical protein